MSLPDTLAGITKAITSESETFAGPDMIPLTKKRSDQGKAASKDDIHAHAHAHEKNAQASATKNTKKRGYASRAFALNKPEYPWITVGFIGAVLNGAVYPLAALLMVEMINGFYLCMKMPESIMPGTVPLMSYYRSLEECRSDCFVDLAGRLCMYVCMCACMYVCMHICIIMRYYVCLCESRFIHICFGYMDIHAYTHTHT